MTRNFGVFIGFYASQNWIERYNNSSCLVRLKLVQKNPERFRMVLLNCMLPSDTTISSYRFRR